MEQSWEWWQCEWSAVRRWIVNNNPLVMANTAATAVTTTAVRTEPANCRESILMVCFSPLRYAQAGHRPSNRTCWRLRIYPSWGIFAMGREISVMHRVTPQFVQVKCG